jgi:putative hydrolase of the HAD superfamily
VVRNRPKAILVDLDDTILDDSGSVERCWRTVCEDAARDVAGLEVELLLAATAKAATWYWSDPARHRVGRADLRAATTRVVHNALISIGRDDPDLARAIAHAYRDLRDAAIAPFPRAIDTLAELIRRGFRLALLTNGAGPAQRVKIERFGLAPYFAAIHIEGEQGVGKPDERAYHLALEALGVIPRDAWMVGDNFEWEVVVPGRLGLGTVWVDRRGTGIPADAPIVPDFVIESFDQILPLLGHAS